MNIYFACSITGGREDENIYRSIVDTLLGDGHTVPTAYLSYPEVIELEAVVNPEDVYTRDIAWIDACDTLIAEVSTPSHGVGFEIAYALNNCKPVLCCYRYGKPISKMITGNSNPLLKVKAYHTTSEATKIVRDFLKDIDTL